VPQQPQRIRCRLDEIMRERGLTQNHEVAERVGCRDESIAKLRHGPWGRIDTKLAGKVCHALGVAFGDLFEFVPLDIWYPVRRDRKLSVHLGSTALASPASGSAANIDRQGIGTWDVRALFKLSDFLNGMTPGGVPITYVEHNAANYDPGDLEEHFSGGNHLILGSPLVNPAAEDFVCRGMQVPARTPEQAAALPYGFHWSREVRSTFGKSVGPDAAVGVARRDGAVIARRTVVPPGEDGDDCGLVFTHRFAPQPPGAREQPSDERDCIVVVIMGHSGCGTLAGAELVTDMKIAERLYPTERDRGALCAFSVRYRRLGTTSGFDDREVTAKDLVS
jgi:DNA-binding Xre family transcriptional regulator